VKIAVYDILGRELTVLADGIQQAGSHQVVWNASTCPSGIYFSRLETNGYVQTEKIVLQKEAFGMSTGTTKSLTSPSDQVIAKWGENAVSRSSFNPYLIHL